jgi:hypothetical protein
MRLSLTASKLALVDIMASNVSKARTRDIGSRH